MESNKDGSERRVDLRKPYSGHVFFATKCQIFEGVLKIIAGTDFLLKPMKL